MWIRELRYFTFILLLIVLSGVRWPNIRYLASSSVNNRICSVKFNLIADYKWR